MPNYFSIVKKAMHISIPIHESASVYIISISCIYIHLYPVFVYVSISIYRRPL
jgi:hypothetical protein